MFCPVGTRRNNFDSTLNKHQDVESTFNRRCFNVVCLLGRALARSGRMVSNSDFGERGPRFESGCRRNSAYYCTALHCTDPSIITLPLSQYDLNNVERDVKHQNHRHVHLQGGHALWKTGKTGKMVKKFPCRKKSGNLKFC